MDQLKLFFHPSEEEINSFLPHLKREYDMYRVGFYPDWDLISSSRDQDQMMTLHLNDEPIGFLTWKRNEKVVFLKTIWVIPKHRKKGIGLKFQQMINKEFKKRGDVALHLFCATEEGVSLARRSGFIPMSNNAKLNKDEIKFGPQANYIKILRNTEALFHNNSELTILCYERFGQADRFADRFYGEICLSADFEKKPVYWHIEWNWECQVVYQGHVIYETAMKYILRDLGIKTYDDMVAYIDHNITIPTHWFQRGKP